MTQNSNVVLFLRKTRNGLGNTLQLKLACIASSFIIASSCKGSTVPSMTLTKRATALVRRTPLNNRLSRFSYLCKENEASAMDSYGNNRNQRGRGSSRLNNTSNDIEEPEEKVQYGNQETAPFIDHNNITAQDVMQQRLIERLHAEERHQLRQHNQQLLQLAQNQARRRQLLQQQIQHAVGNASDPLSAMPLIDNHPLMQSPQQRNRQIEYIQARRQNLMELHLLREQRLRREEELLEAVLRGDQRQASLTGMDRGVNLAASSLRLRSPTDSELLQSEFNIAAGILPGAHLNPEIELTPPGRIEEEQEILDRILQRQRHQSLLFDVDNTIDNLDSSISRIQDRDPSPFVGQINTAPASYRAIDPTRLDSGLQLSRRHLTGQALDGGNYMDSIQGATLQPWMTPSVALGSYPSTELISAMNTKPDDKKKTTEKKKSVSRKKVAGMVCLPVVAAFVMFFWHPFISHILLFLKPFCSRNVHCTHTIFTFKKNGKKY
jgi:hypothetical protein